MHYLLKYERLMHLYERLMHYLLKCERLMHFRAKLTHFLMKNALIWCMKTLHI